MPPINTQPRTRNLYPRVHVRKHRQLLRRDLAQKEHKVVAVVFLKKVLDFFKNRSVALPPQRAQNNPKHLGCLRHLYLLLPNTHHLIHFVDFLREFLGVGVVLEKPQMRIPYHGALNMKPAVSQKNNNVTCLGLDAQIRRGAPEDLAF